MVNRSRQTEQRQVVGHSQKDRKNWTVIQDERDEQGRPVELTGRHKIGVAREKKRGNSMGSLQQQERKHLWKMFILIRPIHGGDDTGRRDRKRVPDKHGRPDESCTLGEKAKKERGKRGGDMEGQVNSSTTGCQRKLEGHTLEAVKHVEWASGRTICLKSWDAKKKHSNPSVVENRGTAKKRGKKNQKRVGDAARNP